MAIENPGSWDEWSQRQSGDTGEVLYSEYSEALHRYRASIALERGMTEDQLHEGYDPKASIKVGELAVEHETQLAEVS